MFSAFLAFLTALPALLNGVNAFASKYFDAKVQITAAQIGGDVEKAKALVAAANVAQHERRMGLSVIAGSKVLLGLVVAFAAPLAIYYGKCLVWDKVLGWGSTDPIVDPLLVSMTNTIVWAIFGSGSSVTVAAMWFGKKG